MTIEELEFLRYFSNDDTIFRLYKQLKSEGKTDQEICDYIEYCDTAAISHEGLVINKVIATVDIDGNVLTMRLAE